MDNKSPKYSLSKRIAIGLIGLIICVIAVAIVIFYWPQNNLEGNVKIEIPKGSTLTQISELLSEKEIISNSNMFITAAKLMGYSNKIPAGIFSINDAKNNRDIVKQLVHGTAETVKITLIEGWTIPQIVEAISHSLNISSEKLAILCYDEQFISELGIDAKSLEGYLYPNTYLFLESENDPKTVLTQIYTEFEKIITSDVRLRAEQIGFSLHEILTIASLVEGEAIFSSERNIVSAVYHNRLRKGMLLQADPTIQYILKEEPRRLLYSDLKIDSPYNTYLYPGLPPGPISNPSKASILAALYPDDNDYLFFVARGDGYHTFTRTVDEHNQAKREFQKVRRMAAQG